MIIWRINRMKADEMFKELGYKKHDNHPEHDFPPEPNMLTTQDCRQLYYEQEGELKGGRHGLEHIEFFLGTKIVGCYALLDGKMTVVPLNLKELGAINQKCIELGWLDK